MIVRIFEDLDVFAYHHFLRAFYSNNIKKREYR